MELFTDEFLMTAMKKTAYREGMESGMMKGLAGLFRLVKKGRLTLDEASEEAQMPIADFRQRMSEYERANAQ